MVGPAVTGAVTHLGASSETNAYADVCRDGFQKGQNGIIDLYDKAVASANDRDRQDALAYLEDHLKRHN